MVRLEKKQGKAKESNSPVTWIIQCIQAFIKDSNKLKRQKEDSEKECVKWLLL